MNTLKKNLKRLTALLLCAVMVLGALPLRMDLSPHASAAWSTRYVEKMRQLGIMAGDGQSMAENRAITRAEIAAMLNRAYGYTRTGPIPFTDVPRTAWYYNDIVTAYNEGIMSGTSATTASPNALVTREQALVLIGNAMRLEKSPGEVTEFTDGRSFSSWSAPYVRSALLAGIVSGLPDGSFAPKKSITRGEVACILSGALGTLINTQGETILGGVFGNVTINTAHVTLRDTVIAGDLYLTGGVGLGDVLLDNVRVLGRIVVAGGGEAQIGQDSILLNNVTAHKLQIDPATGQYVSIRALGSTDIPETVVKGGAYIQDDVRDNTRGLRVISLEAADGAAFTLAGNLKQVINRTPGSTLTIGDTGNFSAKSVTVDEKATGSTLVLDINAAVDQVNLDTASRVTGSGDIGQLNVSTNGSVCEILPDEVTVRPGVITTIQDMTDVDSEVAKEISSDPRLLEGYPKVKNLAPTSADGYFSVNKAGTIYWAITNAAVGPLDDSDVEDLISPSEYGSGMMQYGSIQAEKSKTEYNVPITGLEAGGTYYLSAVLTDAHGRRSPVKSQKILTPDGTVPALAAGFPTIADRTPTRSDETAELSFGELMDMQATVMANKTCDLYYVLLAAGSSQPQTSEFLSSSFVDPYGYGRLHLIKNTMDSFKINEVDMDLDGESESLGDVEENTSYDLYLWLTDADGSQSSRITKVTVKTKDITPPEFNLDNLIQTASQATGVRLSNSLNEAGTVYWVAVPTGQEYPQPRDGASSTDPEFLRSEYAKLQVINGMNGFKSGKVTARANVDFTISITGLARESAYDVYYLAVDEAGNYSDPIMKFTAHTLDSTPPTATQEFENAPEDSPDTPYADSTVNIIFSEAIRYKQPGSSSAAPYADPNLLNLYTAYFNAKRNSPTSQETREAETLYVEALRDMIVLYDPSSRRPVTERTGSNTSSWDNWTVDYRNVRVYSDGAQIVVSFVNTGDPATSALNLESGARYYFQLKNIADESDMHNVMRTTSLPIFTTMSAQVFIHTLESNRYLNAYGLDEYGNLDYTQAITSTGDDDAQTADIPIDISFTAEPRSTANTADGVCWDMLFWFDTSVEFELFTRKHSDDPNAAWAQVGGDGATLSITIPDGATDLRGVSMTENLGHGDYHNINEEFRTSGLYCGLNDLDGIQVDYALHFVRIGTNSTRSTFSQLISGQVTFITGATSSLVNVANTSSSAGAFNSVLQERNSIREITFDKNLDTVPRLLFHQFSDGRAPQLVTGSPVFYPTDSGVNMSLRLDRPGTVYYVLSEVNNDTGVADLPPSDGGHNTVPDDNLNYIATSGSGVTTIGGTADGEYDPQNGIPNGKTLNTSAAETVDRYKFVYPTSLSIISPTSPGSGLTSPNLITGSAEIGEANEDVPIEGLKPDTTYYVYLATKGVSDVISEVKLYQFHTKPVTRPVITLRTSGSNITISSDIDTIVDYMIVPYSSAMDDTITKEFIPEGGEGLTHPDRIFEAMGKPVQSGTLIVGSWFDLYGRQVDKEDIGAYIRTQQANGSSVIGTGTVDVEGNGSKVIDCAKDFKLELGIDYCFLAVGRSPANSGDAFAATYPFQVRDEDAPVINVVNNTLYAYQLKDDISSNRWYIGGTLRLTFNEPLYYLERISGQQTLSPVTNNEAAKNDPHNQYKLTADIVEKPLDPGVKIITESGTSVEQAISITIAFSVDGNGTPINPDTGTAMNASPAGSSVTFYPGLSDGGYNARMNNPLSVSVNVRRNGTDEDGNPIYVPVVTIPSAWLDTGVNPNPSY